MKNAAQVVDTALNKYGDRAMREYGSDVIGNRAIVDYRDGLLPVQRRILFAMYKLGLHQGRNVLKSARIVGDVIGKYSPHGDLATYGALVKMVNTSEPLVFGEGNL